jgi:hypothetical protein
MKIAIDQNVYVAVLQAKLIDVFEKNQNVTVNPVYQDRKERNEFAAMQLMQSASVTKILNIGGGGKRHLADCINDDRITVTEVDIQGDCDLKVNLDNIDRLPYEDKSFDVVCAFDVLEHLENFHLINDEMFRIAKDYVLISLPNSASEIFYDVIWNRGQKNPDINRGVFSIFYGLPLRLPVDRHRWWLYFQDIIRFYFLFSLEKNVRVEFWIPSLNFKKRLFRAVFGKHIYYTFFCSTVWIKIYK